MTALCILTVLGAVTAWWWSGHPSRKARKRRLRRRGWIVRSGR